MAKSLRNYRRLIMRTKKTVENYINFNVPVYKVTLANGKEIFMDPENLTMFLTILIFLLKENRQTWEIVGNTLYTGEDRVPTAFSPYTGHPNIMYKPFVSATDGYIDLGIEVIK